MRLEYWNDGYTRPTDWGGRGQPTAFEKVAPTKWTVLIYWISNGYDLYHFDALRKRQNFIAARRLQYEIIQDRTGQSVYRTA